MSVRQALARIPWPRPGSQVMMAGMVLLALLTFMLVGWHFTYEARSSADSNLAAIAELKAHEIERLLEERRHAAILAASRDLPLAMKVWAGERQQPHADELMRASLNSSLRRLKDASRIDLYDPSGRFLISSAERAPDFASLTGAATGEAPQPHFVDLHMSAASGAPRLGFVVALGRDDYLPGFAYIEFDPELTLYPTLAVWPGSQRSGELVLARIDGRQLDYLAPLGAGRIAALSTHAGLDELGVELPRPGMTLLSPGRDYRQIEVRRALHDIEDGRWWLAAKVDEQEILAPARLATLYAGLFIAITTFALLLLAHQNNRFALTRALQRERERYAGLLQAFMNAVPETLLMLKPEGRLELINQTGARRLGSTPEQMIGQDIFRQLSPEIAASRRAALERARDTEVPQRLIDHRQGREFESMIYPLGDGEHVVVIGIDVTERNADARRAQRLQATLQSFIDHLPGTAYVKDHESRVLMANRGFQTLLGIDPAGMIGKLSSEIFPGEFGAKIVADDLRALASGETEVLEEELAGRHYESIKFCIPRDEGPPGLGGVTLDVTARFEALKALREREALFRTVGDNLPESYLYQILTGPGEARSFTYISSGVERIHGITPESVLADGQQLYACVHQEDVAVLADTEMRCQTDCSEFSMELRMRRREGDYGWFIMRSRPQVLDNGQLLWNGVITEITTRRRTELLIELQARRANALLSMPLKAEVLDEAGFLSFAQDLAEALTASQIAFIHFISEDGRSIELVAWSRNTLAHYCQAVFDKHYPLEKAGIWADAARLQRPVMVNDYPDAPNKRGLPEGHATLQRLITVPVIEEGRVRMLAGVGNKASDYTDTDVESLQLIANEAWRISRKRRIESALRQTAQVVQASPAICFRWRLEEGWPVEFVSDNVRRWGYEPAALVAGEPSFASLIHAEDLARIGEEVGVHLAAGHAEYVQEYRLRCASGEYIWVSDYTTVARDVDGRVCYVDGVLTDISERKAQEAYLAENLRAQEALNRRLEEAHTQLLQAEKLAAIGQLAAGVAHELNNPIGFVHSNLGTLSEYCTALIALCDAYTTLIDEAHPDNPNLAEIRRIKQDQDYNYLRSDIFPLLEESREGLQRVRKIVLDLRDFSRTGEQDWGFADLHRGLDATLNILANELKYKCKVHKAYGRIPEIECVISQLNQVFMNLLVNAAQAIETQGDITITSCMVGEDQVSISIADTGQGISPEHFKHIFDPFFTTKPIGVGTGLGLSLVFGIVNRHHGRIEVSSEVGQGTTFRILLPIRQPAPAEPSESNPSQEAPYEPDPDS
ncbi:PAS domain-containing protein [Uliginosibacterium sp. 31-12]|uniref:PAS domain-containing protein n=1 Tax=Uliginosibacterium sp. 31-12 TaxID=3062781 RepID=UPI0026E44CCC|nr:PAS domain-containing protein [Uliginosibacterium sp. 31-12]MDO6385127.1 PAS domain-containing protein [Uliginosibacterium sp. 31-12]